ncbi:MAG: hypothetical protein GKR87_11040 [Kiritimatiellae bacterium]|nr:hypothetical protein [Kiritimatiellia bacterium]
MTWRQFIPTIFTSAAMLVGFFSLITCAMGQYMTSAQLIMLSMLLDGLDGNLARLFKGTTKFGAELDTYVDITSFGIAPALLAYLAVLKHFGLLGILITSFIVLSGAIRLSRFRIKDPYRGQRGYQGLPITVNACWVSMFVFVTESNLLDFGLFSLSKGPLATIVWTSTLLFMVLQVSNVRYPKPTKELLGFIPCIIFVCFLFLKVQLAVASALTICASCFVYAFITPLLPKRSAVIDEADEEESFSVWRT